MYGHEELAAKLNKLLQSTQATLSHAESILVVEFAMQQLSKVERMEAERAALKTALPSSAATVTPIKHLHLSTN